MSSARTDPGAAGSTPTSSGLEFRTSSTRQPLRRFSARGGAAVLGVVAGLSAASAGCDPCAGVVACVEAPRLAVSGEILDRGDPTTPANLSGAGIPQATPVAGVRIEVIATGGVAVDGGSAAVTTDGSGRWSVTLPARDTGAVTADVVVTPPGKAGYRVSGVQLRVSRTRGAGNVLGRWTHQLYMTKLGEIITSPTGARPAGARVTATRRGGIEIAPTRNTVSPMVTGDGGRFLYDVRPLSDGPLVLDFVIERPGLPTATVRNITVLPQHEWGPTNVDGAISFRIDSLGNLAGT